MSANRQYDICICTSYDSGFASIGDQTSRTITAYAQKHGYAVEVVRNVSFERHPAWHRIKFIEQLFDRGHEYVLWIDSDAYFRRFDVDVSSIINDHSDLYLVQHDHPDYRPVPVPNTGVMLVRNTQWSRSLLKTLWSMVQYANHPWWENAALVKLLGYNSLLGEGANAVNHRALARITFVSGNWNCFPSAATGRSIIVHYAGISNEERRKRIPQEVESALQTLKQNGRSAARIDRRQLLRQGIYVQKVTGHTRLMSLIKRLRPVGTSHDLIRVGSENEGGYLVPCDLEGISACFSAGVGQASSFEADLLTRYDIPSHLCDNSLEAAPGKVKAASHERKLIGALDDDSFTTLDSWIERKPEHPHDSDLMLQMDIKGGEYIALLSISDSNLKRFRIIVMEIHNVEHWSNPLFFGMVEAAFAKLLKWFHVVHIHPNNHGEILQLGSIEVPQILQVTLIRKDRFTELTSANTLPHPLDRPCHPSRPDLALPDIWHTSS
jgi:hypothetical protein